MSEKYTKSRLIWMLVLFVPGGFLALLAAAILLLGKYYFVAALALTSTGIIAFICYIIWRELCYLMKSNAKS